MSTRIWVDTSFLVYQHHFPTKVHIPVPDMSLNKNPSRKLITSKMKCLRKSVNKTRWDKSSWRENASKNNVTDTLGLMSVIKLDRQWETRKLKVVADRPFYLDYSAWHIWLFSKFKGMMKDKDYSGNNDVEVAVKKWNLHNP